MAGIFFWKDGCVGAKIVPSWAEKASSKKSGQSIVRKWRLAAAQLNSMRFTAAATGFSMLLEKEGAAPQAGPAKEKDRVVGQKRRRNKTTSCRRQSRLEQSTAVVQTGESFRSDFAAAGSCLASPTFSAHYPINHSVSAFMLDSMRRWSASLSNERSSKDGSFF